MIVDQSGKIIGAEGLTRWQNHEKGMLSPAVFIEHLKSAGLIDKLDFYILEEVCKQLEKWNRTGKEHLWLSCNFTRMTVSRNDFIERFRSIVGKYDFSPDRLVIELTEDSFINNTTIAYNNVFECKKIGCKIALDDMGSGYSSLQDLCDYPVDMLKIDRQILLKSTTPRGDALLKGLTKLGHDLGMKVLCEGVENEEDKRRVCEADCDYIQGFYYSRVLPTEEADLFYMRSQNS
jgi:EAL domain-containing protein (putative c-di-GMP-specific phosphodiesterase class I)